MRRGTTPRYKIKLPFDIKTVVSDLRLTFEQENVEVLTKKLEDCTVDRDILSVWLTQEETLSFNASVPVKIQVKILERDGNVVSHQPRLESCKEILNEEILSDKSGIATLDLIEVEQFPETPKDGKVYRTEIDGKTAIGTPNENGDKLFFEYKDGQWVDMTATIEAQKTTIAEQVEELADKAETIEEQSQTIAEKQTTIESFNKAFPSVDELPNEVEEGAVYRVRVARTTSMETLFMIRDGFCLPLRSVWKMAGFSDVVSYNEVKVEDIENITDHSNYPPLTIFIDTTTGIGYIFVEDEFDPGTIRRHTLGEFLEIADKGKIHNTADATEDGIYYADVYTKSGIAIANEFLETIVFIRRNDEWVNVSDGKTTE